MVLPPQLPSHSSAVEQAVFWLTLLHSGQFDETEQQAFQSWLKEDPAHAKAWEKACALWRDLEQLDESHLEEIEQRVAGQQASR